MMLKSRKRIIKECTLNSQVNSVSLWHFTEHNAGVIQKSEDRNKTKIRRKKKIKS